MLLQHQHKAIPLHKTAGYRNPFVQKPMGQKILVYLVGFYNQYGSESNADVREVVLNGEGAVHTRTK
jgi:hypothetical protein